MRLKRGELKFGGLEVDPVCRHRGAISQCQHPEELPRGVQHQGQRPTPGGGAGPQHRAGVREIHRHAQGVLATLVQAFEARHWPLASAVPVQAIKFRMEPPGLMPRDLEPLIGRLKRVCQVL